MTTDELALIVAENTRAMAEANRAIAETNHAVTKLTGMMLTLHESVRSLAASVASHDDSMEELRAIVADTQKQWQAYVNRLPKT